MSGLLVVSVLAAGGASALAGAAQVRARDFPTAAAVPDDALAYVVVTLDDGSEQWQLAQRLIERAGLGEVLAQALDGALTDAGLGELPRNAVLGGQVALVVTDAALARAAAASEAIARGGSPLQPAAEDDPAADPAATGAALVLAAGAPSRAATRLQSVLERQATDTENEIVEADYEGVTIRSVAGMADGSADPLAVAQVDDLILLAGSPVDLEPLIDAGQGATPAIADLGALADVRGALDQDFLLFGFFNGVAAGAAAAAGGFGVPAALGAGDRYSGVLVLADDPGFRIETVAIAAGDGELPPAAANFESELLGRAPAAAALFLSASDLGQTGVLDAVGAALLTNLTTQLGAAATPVPDQPPEELVAAQYERVAALIGVNFQTDLFQQLTGEYGFWVGVGGDGVDLGALFVSGVADPDVVGGALAQLTLLIQGAGGGTTSVTTREVNGSSVSVIESGDAGAAAIEYGVVDGQFVLGLGTAVDEFVAGPADSLADNPRFQDVMATLPDDTNGLLYVDLGHVIPLAQSSRTAPDTAGREQAAADASDDCADYATQEEAQAAFDAGAEGTFDLDQDFDGEACEDFFAAGDAGDAGAGGGEDEPEAAADIAGADYSAITAFARVAFDEDGMRRSSAILYIEE